MDAALGLSERSPKLQSCTIPQLLAFPTNLAAIKTPVLWNASCWVTDRRLDEFEQAHISRHQGKEHVEWCHFASDRHLNVSLLIVFPHLDSGFRNDPVMQKWTDEIVLPAFSKMGLGAGVLSQSWKVVRMTAEAEREETLNVNAPDTPLRGVLTKRGGAAVTEMDVANVWTEIEERANSHASGLFQGLFLVAVCHMEEGFVKEMEVEESWRQIASKWDGVVDMDYVPVESVRAFARVTLGVQSLHSTTFPVPPTPLTSPIHAPPPMARKRKVDDGDDGGKRSRFGNSDEHSTRPWGTGRLQITPVDQGNGYVSNQGSQDDMEL
ncbi:hypothetical protein EG328_002685 [Venturia inaequalis]|uniref:Uncharacterized protein n=1 Tax=Venturia inaequalis TaxID=5025 RepID=A0A8H3YJ23_VENIN|nr:hypothetical protein EG328_002685 [Venturia inaequalis]RDI83777.1 hypothetical protein Vi05172_g6136 [Venturia inaequalis]